MSTAPLIVDRPRVVELLRAWIDPQAEAEGLAWLDEKRTAVADGAPAWQFFTSFSSVPRYLGKADLSLSKDDLAEAEAACPGWQPQTWSVDQAGRTLLVLALPAADPEAYIATLDKVFDAADVGEAVALYQSLPLLPFPQRLTARAAEGVRTNMTSVFNAIALRNPFPKTYLDDGAWNQMVLKAVFVGSPLYAIDGLDERANPALASMLVDYAHERWAAHRVVTPELWRPVGPFAEGAVIDDLARVLRSDNPAERKAGALALAASPDPRADEVLAGAPDLQQAVADGALTWEGLVDQHLASGD